MIINEIFYSIQGEGLLAGVPSVFIRLAGCPLRCEWCDTKYALDPAAGEDLTIEQIIDKIENIASPPNDERRVTSDECRYIVITGGEPMVNPQLPQLTAELKKLRPHVTIETAGIKFVPEIPCDLMSISPKTSNSGQKTENQAVKQLIEHYPYQLKFVVDTPDDLPEILKFVAGLEDVDPTRVMLMPQAKTRDELLAKSPMVAELCKQAGYVFCNRLQILLYNGQRGK
ncbi:MAG: 7-carboxy-7-deazaguanine synthase QueE [Planctomycetota bacterium]